MKPAKQWVNENSQSGPFDTVGDSEEAEALVAAIQADAVSSSSFSNLKATTATQLPTSLLCRIIGHQWQPSTKAVWKGGREPFCLRCGCPNPNSSPITTTL